MKRFGMKDDDALEDRMISRQIEKAQRKVEQHNFDIRKHLLEFDDVANDQRKVIYRQRDELLEGEEVSATVADIREDVVQSMVRAHVPAESIDEQWDIPALDRELESEFGLSLDFAELGRTAARDRRRDDSSPRARIAWTGCSRPRKRRSAPTPCVSWKSTSC
jgi:preprotein translocase subunit SecA